jgi:hypothetical protein
MSDFTEAEVEATAEAVADRFDCRPVTNEDAEHILAAVDPQIAARALREAADHFTGPMVMTTVEQFEFANWLRARAAALDPATQEKP